MRIEAQGSKGERHRRVQRLVPWYLNGTLESPELEGVVAHLEDCESCRSELAFEKELARAVRSNEEIQYPVERGLRSLELCLDAELLDQGTRSEARESDRGWRHLVPRLSVRRRFVLAASLFAVVVVALVVGYGLGRPRAPEYRVLSNRTDIEAPGARVRVVFDDRMTAGQIRSLLAGFDGEIVDGPSEYGVFTLRVPNGSHEEALERLRQSVWVRFAEPVEEAE